MSWLFSQLRIILYWKRIQHSGELDDALLSLELHVVSRCLGFFSIRRASIGQTKLRVLNQFVSLQKGLCFALFMFKSCTEGRVSWPDLYERTRIIFVSTWMRDDLVNYYTHADPKRYRQLARSPLCMFILKELNTTEGAVWFTITYVAYHKSTFTLRCAVCYGVYMIIGV